jgi:hypothetical protein
MTWTRVGAFPAEYKNKLQSFIRGNTISKMVSKKSTHGGPGRGQGRKPIEEGIGTVPFPVRLTPSQRDKVKRLGGAPWVRDRIDEAQEPSKKK